MKEKMQIPRARPRPEPPRAEPQNLDRAWTGPRSSQPHRPSIRAPRGRALPDRAAPPRAAEVPGGGERGATPPLAVRRAQHTPEPAPTGPPRSRAQAHRRRRGRPRAIKGPTSRLHKSRESCSPLTRGLPVRAWSTTQALPRPGGTGCWGSHFRRHGFAPGRGGFLRRS